MTPRQNWDTELTPSSFQVGAFAYGPGSRAGADTANEGAEYELQFAAPGVGEAAPDHRTQDRADPTAIKDDGRLAVGEMPLRAQHRDQEADDQEVEELQNCDQCEQSEVGPVTSAERGSVEHRQQGRPRQSASPTTNVAAKTRYLPPPTSENRA